MLEQTVDMAPLRAALETESATVARSVPAVVPGKPVLTVTLLVINILVFLLMTLAGGNTRPTVLIVAGALNWPCFRQGDYAAAVTATFIHVGLIHLLFNMSALWVMGKPLEGLIGTVRFALVYFVSAISGSLMSVCLHHHVMSAGASGAIFGIGGAMLVIGLRHPDRIPPRAMKLFGKSSVPFFVLNLALGLAIPGIDILAHLGGILGGAACACGMAPHVDRKWARRLVTLGAVLMTLAAFCCHFIALLVIGLRMH